MTICQVCQDLFPPEESEIISPANKYFPSYIPASTNCYWRREGRERFSGSWFVYWLALDNIINDSTAYVLEPSSDQGQEGEGDLWADETLISQDSGESQPQIVEAYPKEPSFSPDELKAPSASPNYSLASNKYLYKWIWT